MIISVFKQKNLTNTTEHCCCDYVEKAGNESGLVILLCEILFLNSAFMTFH